MHDISADESNYEPLIMEARTETNSKQSKYMSVIVHAETYISGMLLHSFRLHACMCCIERVFCLY